MKKLRKNFTKTLSALVIVSLATACKDEELTPLQPLLFQNTSIAQANINFCTTDGTQQRSELKYIFIFDRSGSNFQVFPDGDVSNPQPGTDPDGSKRFWAVIDYLTKAPGGYNWQASGGVPGPDSREPDDSIYYAYINMAGPPVTGHRFHARGTDRSLRDLSAAWGDPVSDFTNDPIEFGDWIIENEWDPARDVNGALDPDNGTRSIPASWDPTQGDPTQTPFNATPSPDDSYWTDYEAVLTEAGNLIKADIERAKLQPEIVDSMYVIFFISDGVPVVSSDDDGNFVRQPTANIIGLINEPLKSFERLAEDRSYVVSTKLHSGFYTNRDNSGNYFDPVAAQDAIALMQNMATVGTGVFRDFDTSGVDFTLFGAPIRDVRFGLTDLIIENVNAVWDNEFGEILRLDSDGDGLSDNKEIQIGSDRLNADTDGNGVRDFTEYKLTGYPCSSMDPSVNNPPSTVCDPAGAFDYANGSCGGYVDSDGDGISDQAEVAAGTDPLDPPPPAGSPVWFTDLDKDGLNDCEEDLWNTYRFQIDSNDDFLPDYSAVRLGLSAVPFSPQQGPLDPDSDNYQNYDEWKFGTPLRIRNSNVYGLRYYRYSIPAATATAAQDCYSGISVRDISTTAGDNMIRAMIIENIGSNGNRVKLKCAQRRVQDGVVNFTDADFSDPATMCFP